MSEAHIDRKENPKLAEIFYHCFEEAQLCTHLARLNAHKKCPPKPTESPPKPTESPPLVCELKKSSDLYIPVTSTELQELSGHFILAALQSDESAGHC